jgi:predicted metal-dependent phosphoesterase TrpH
MLLDVDLHIHTHYSIDSLNTPDSIIRASKKQGLSIIAITDHNTITGGLQTKRLASQSLEVIIGSEIKVDCGEIIGLFLQEDIPPGSADDVIDAIKDQGGISVFAHPFRKKFSDISIPFQRCDLIEGWNGRTTVEKNHLAQKEAEHNNKFIIGGSDAHFPFEIGSIRNQLFIDDPSDMQEQIRELIYRGKTKQFISINYPWMGIAGYFMSGGLKKLYKLKHKPDDLIHLK